MQFLPFFDEFPTLIHSEFRNIDVIDNRNFKYIPLGNYAFLEMFCTDINCDCRKVIIHVISVNPSKIWAILNYGWESEEYYRTWWGKTYDLYQPMSGLTFDSPTNDPLKKEFFELFQYLIKNDKAYAQRIVTHYFMFKKKIRERKNDSDRIPTDIHMLKANKAERNDPCPCNSGKKFKKCCLLITLH